MTLKKWGGMSLEQVMLSVREHHPASRACYVYDLDMLETRARRMASAFAWSGALVAYAIKANAFAPIASLLAKHGLGADAGSVGELELAAAAGFPPARTVLNGNGRTPEEADWAARRSIHSVNADHVAELDLLQESAHRAGTRLRVALRVNPRISTAGHPYVATGHGAAKFGVGPEEALEAWSARSRWPSLQLDGLHMHVGSQLMDSGPIQQVARLALELAAESARRSAPVGLINLGGGFGIDYSRDDGELEIEPVAAWLAERAGVAVQRAGASAPGASAGGGSSVLGTGSPASEARGGAPERPRFDWTFEPGRWLVARCGVLLSEVLWIKERDGNRFVVLAAGMNDLIRPALYGAQHRIIPLRPRAGTPTPAQVVGPVCESADVFDDSVVLPPIERGDLVAILDVGAYGSAMASNYNGRDRLAEVGVAGGKVVAMSPPRGVTPRS